MTESDVREMLLRKLGMRIQPEMAGYVLKRIQPESSGSESFPVMGADARTGAPVRQMVDPAILEA